MDGVLLFELTAFLGGFLVQKLVLLAALEPICWEDGGQNPDGGFRLRRVSRLVLCYSTPSAVSSKKSSESSFERRSYISLQADLSVRITSKRKDVIYIVCTCT